MKTGTCRWVRLQSLTSTPRQSSPVLGSVKSLLVGLWHGMVSMA